MYGYGPLNLSIDGRHERAGTEAKIDTAMGSDNRGLIFRVRYEGAAATAHGVPQALATNPGSGLELKLL